MTTPDSTTATKPKTRTITLTDRAPVKIREDQWTIIARGDGKSTELRNGTPVPDYEVDSYTLIVRMHADGRAIVYGILDASTAWTGTEDHKAGYLLTPPGDGPLTADDGRVIPGEELVRHIRAVGTECGIPDRVIRECISDLPADEI